MSKKNSNNGVKAGLVAGLVSSFMNNYMQIKNQEIEDRENEEILDSFTNVYNRKLDGYKLAYDINESIIKPKYVSLIKEDDLFYTICVSDKKIEGALGYYREPNSEWHTIDSYIFYHFEDIKNDGIIRFHNCKPKYYVYCTETDESYIIINISNIEEDEYKYIPENEIKDDLTQEWDRFRIQSKEEAIELAKEIKRYYHNYYERVVILDEAEDIPGYIGDVDEALPNYSKIINTINNINNPKYNDIGKILEECDYEVANYIVYTMFSLSIQLYSDSYYNEAEYVFESLLKMDDIILKESVILYDIHRSLMDVYIKTRKEKKIINLIETAFKEEFFYISILADRLYNLGLKESAIKFYEIICKNADRVDNIPVNLFTACLRTENDLEIRALRERLVAKGESTWDIDRYFSDNDPEALSIKIDRLEKEESWEEIIYYCNRYNKLIRQSSREDIGKIYRYEIKKINAYIQLNKYEDAWISCCKSRRTLISNFKDIDYFDYLSKVENYMTEICLKQEYLIDAIFHYTLKTIYKDVYEFHEKDNPNNPIWNTDLLLSRLR